MRHLEVMTGDKAALLRHTLLTLSNYSNFAGAEACYQRSCRDSINIEPLQNHTPAPVRGRPVSSKENTNFETLCEWLEDVVELYTLSELHQKMVELAELHENVYSKKRFKNHLKKKYHNIFFFFHEHSWFTGQQGKGEVISLIPLYYFHLLHRHLDSQAITAESSPLHIATSRTRIGNLWFPSEWFVCWSVNAEWFLNWMVRPRIKIRRIPLWMVAGSKIDKKKEKMKLDALSGLLQKLLPLSCDPSRILQMCTQRTRRSATWT